MPETDIVIRGAREHNLRDVSLTLPRNKLIVMTGVSGSGKSSLAFDTLYAEGQRRYVESLSSYARQFLGQMPKPEVDSITGLAPSISIQQKTSGRNPRSTVGTITEIYDYLRVLFARVGQGFCPKCDRPITAQTREQILESLLKLADGTRFLVLAPVVQRQKGEYRDLFEDLLKQGFLRARVDGRYVQLTENLQLDRQMRHTIDVVIDRLKAGAVGRTRLAEAVESALRLGNGSLVVAFEGAEQLTRGEGGAARVESKEKRGKSNKDFSPLHSPLSPEPAQPDRLYSAHYACTHCGISYEPPSPQLFSFNSPQGMCPDCNGLGTRYDFDLALLIPDETLSLAKGAVALVGRLRDIGRWRRHVIEGVARALERDENLEEGSLLQTPWNELPGATREKLLFGTGDRNITFAWKHRGGVWKHGGVWVGIVPELLESYRKAKNPMRRRQLERYMTVARCKTCRGARLNGQAASVRVTSASYENERSGVRDQGSEVRGQKSEKALPPFARGGRGGRAELAAASFAINEKENAEHRTSNIERQRSNGGGDTASVQRRTTRPAEKNPQSAIRNPQSRASLSLPQVCALTIAEAASFFEQLDLDATGRLIAEEVLKEIRGRLGFLLRCGLDYLTLDRQAPTLSGGESQRIRLAGQIGCGLVGVVYILDEPSIGLHPRDNDMLLGSLLQLRDQGNTVIVVEHDEETMRAADHIVDFGPGPGVRGGYVVAQGSLEEIRQAPRSVTGKYLSGELTIAGPATRQPLSKNSLTIVGARHHNLRDIDVTIPLERFVCVTGVSGSGKSSLVNDILWEALNRDLNKGNGIPGAFKKLKGLEHLDKAIDIDQSPIGRTPRSNPATYVKLFDQIRDLYTQLPDAKLRGYKPGRFSFNVAGGRCEACEGNGSTRLEMDFLADVWVTCPVCNGHRFNRETLEVKFKGKGIAEVLEMDVQQALEHFSNLPKIKTLLQTLHDVGLDYLKLGQPSPTLSGGEAQRIKLARELGKRATGRTIYLLDEPTTGLHFADVQKLLEVLHGLVDLGNTVIVVEHNLDVIKTADWIVDLGPEGGAGGGAIVVEGTPDQVAACATSHTGEALRKTLAPPTPPLRKGGQGGSRRIGADTSLATRRDERPTSNVQRSTSNPTAQSNGVAQPIVVRGAAQHNLQDVDISIPRHSLSVFCGPSGSGKSSLAMDTLYAEGQRRYVESLSAYARQFLGQMPKPRVTHVSGLSPAIAIEQKTVGNTPRSTVGTVTEIYDYLRILFARLGQNYCPTCDLPVRSQTTDEVVEQILKLPAGTKLLLLAPQEVPVGDSYEKLWNRLKAGGMRRVRVDGATYAIEAVPEFDRRRKHEVEIVVDRISVARESRGRIADSIEAALDLGRGWLHVARVADDRPESDWQVDRYSLHKACTSCGRSFEDLSPNNFSFNSSLGWCPGCEGLGTQQGTNLSALIADPKRSLADGAIAAWPDPAKNQVFRAILQALAREFRLPLDVPFEKLDARQQRVVLYGAGEKWLSVSPGESGLSGPFRLQYKGLYPAIEEAARVSYPYRLQLDHLAGEVPCSACHGSRLREDAAAVRFGGRTLQELCELPLGDCLEFLRNVKLERAGKKVAGDLLREATGRLSFLVEVGLHYLTLARTMPTLSGGESQRIRLAGQVGRALTGVLYVLDEPTIGLHPRDNQRLLKTLRQLRDLGNTVVLVEHDREVLEASDRLYDFGPGAGRFGGTIVDQGSPRELTKRARSLTGKYLSGDEEIPIPNQRRMHSTLFPSQLPPFARGGRGGRAAQPETSLATGENTNVQHPTSNVQRRTKSTGESNPQSAIRNPKSSPTRPSLPPPCKGGESPADWLELRGARHHNLRDVDLRIPLGTLTCITGVSGSGKSSLIEETLARAVARKLHGGRDLPGAFDELLGIEHVNKIITVDQQPLGTTPASNPATYTGVFDHIRELFARLPESKVRGYRPGRFSFNRAGGRCEACEGNGQKCIEMHFLPDVWVECDECKGRRFNAETLLVQYKGQSIADVLEMSIGQARELFDNIPAIRAILATLCAVGLDYLTLGQSAATLSGGEAQRVKLAAELARPQTGKTLYILDEPTTGLHFDDIRKLLKVLHSLVESGNTVVVIEHNLDVLKTADWIVDLGPEAGEGGGWIVAEGTPEDVATLAGQFYANHDSPSALPPFARGGRGGRAAQLEASLASAEKINIEHRTSNVERRTLNVEHPTSNVQRPTKSTGEPNPPSAIRNPQSLPTFRSYTGELLGPLLEHGRRAELELFDAQGEARKRQGDLDLRQVGRDTRMPWQVDGRRWHTADRVGHNGQPCRWEGSALQLVVDQVETATGFASVNWNDRSVVEATGTGSPPGWFLHALTGDEWLLTLRFRVDRNTFREEQLQAELGLKPLDDLDELPVYGRGSRVRLKSLKGGWQEVTVTVHWQREVDTPAFRRFLDRAMRSYLDRVHPKKLDIKELTPWKVLGRKWHIARKGFPSGKRVAWAPEVLDRLLQLLEQSLPKVAIDWSNKQVVHFRRQGEEPIAASVYTKRRGGIDLTLVAPAGRFALGRVAHFGSEREVAQGSKGFEEVRIRFETIEQVQSNDLQKFIRECCQNCNV